MKRVLGLFGFCLAAQPFIVGADEHATLSVYGFAMGDAIYDFKRVDPDWKDTLRVTTIPTEEGTFGANGEFTTSVRQSRLGIKGQANEHSTFLLEAELFGVGIDAGQTTPRLRHAWATYKNIGVGQYWSNFMDADVFPNTIDYWGPTGMVFFRNQQLRYSFDMQDDEFSVALEKPGTALTTGQFRDQDGCSLPNSPPSCDATDSTIEQLVQAHNNLPDVSVRYRDNTDFGHWQVAGIVRKLGYERLDNGSTGSKTGWGINASSVIRFGENDKLKLQAVYGEGFGNYLNDGGVDLAPNSANLAEAGIATVPILGIVMYYDHYWNAQWSSSIGYSFADLDTLDGQADNEFAKGEIAQFNLLHQPMDNVMLGAEFIYGKRTDVSDQSGEDYRIQFSLKVGFDSGNLLTN